VKHRYDSHIPLVIYDRFIGTDGQLIYPKSGNPQRPWIPELFGNAVLVNGKLLPFLDVKPQRYRIRLLNASNARQFHLSFLNGEDFHQIGSDQGLLSEPVPRKTLFIAPDERADLIVDFSRHRGEQIVVKTDLFARQAPLSDSDAGVAGFKDSAVNAGGSARRHCEPNDDDDAQRNALE
jgi:spore coat protein A